MITVKLKSYESFKSKLREEQKINNKNDLFLTKKDKLDMIKWMVGFWIAQMAAIIGLYIKK